MSYSEKTIQSLTGKKLFTNRYTQENAICNLIIVHGFGHHSFLDRDAKEDQWKDIVDRFIEKQFNVFGLDHLGFGRSEGTLGYVKDIDIIIDDIQHYIETEIRKDNDLPLYAFSESMGGAIALKWSIRESFNLDGLILASPMVKVAPESTPPAWQIPILKFASHLIPKARVIPIGGTQECFKLEEEQEIAERDVLFDAGKVRLRTGYEMLQLTNYITDNFDKVTTPFILFHGTSDQLTSYQYSQELYDQCSSKDKTIKIIPEGFHALRQEPDEIKNTIYTDIFQWLEDRIPGENKKCNTTKKGKKRNTTKKGKKRNTTKKQKNLTKNNKIKYVH